MIDASTPVVDTTEARLYQGFETKDPRALVLAQSVGLLTAWVIVTALAVTLFVQALYESTQAAIVMGAIVGLLVLGPVFQLSRKRFGIDPIPQEGTQPSNDLVYRG